MTTEAKQALDGVELAIRRVHDRLKAKSAWSKTSKDLFAIELLESLADEITKISAGIPR